jgi:hypothetical protein
VRENPRLSYALTELWAKVFPMVLPPDREDGLGIVLLNSNADTHFSFTNALGMVSAEQVRGLEIARENTRAPAVPLNKQHRSIELTRS